MRFKRWLFLLLLGTLILALGVYLGRHWLKQAVIACKIQQMHIFTPPPLSLGESGWHRGRADFQFYWDVAALRLAREKRVEQLTPEYRPLLKEVNRHQAAGESMTYSMHIYREIRWRLNFTSDLAATRARIADLRASLTQPALQQRAAEQQAEDGSWGLGINVWYLRLYYSVDPLADRPPEQALRYPLSFLDPINSPEKLTAKLDADLHNDFTKTGSFNREELDETFSGLARLIIGKKDLGYAFHPQLQPALQEFVAHWQNPSTGCWGQWLVDREGRIWKMDDMAMTFHVISDLKGRVDHLDQIAKRVLQLDAINFPAGVRFNDHYENHLNWDVVKIFRVAWPHLDEATRDQVRARISQMLHWCLTQSYQPDGSFKVSDLDETLVDACSYGDSFLSETGFYRREDRFWTDQDFPEAEAMHQLVSAKRKALGLNH